MLNPKVLAIGFLALSLGACSPEKQAEKSSVKQEVQKEAAVEQLPKVSFEQLYTDWRAEQISAKKYESEKNCTPEITLADDYKGPGIGLPLAAELEAKFIKRRFECRWARRCRLKCALFAMRWRKCPALCEHLAFFLFLSPMAATRL